MATVIHSSYPPDEPPAHPGSGWTRFVCISDTHSKRYPVPPGDVLLHAGDLSSWGTQKQLRKTVDWLKELPHELKIVIAGNHDLCLDLNWKSDGIKYGLDGKEVDAARELMRSESVRAAGIVYLDHEQTDIVTPGGVRWKVYGSPAAPVYVEGAFQYNQGEEGRVEWARIPSDVEILMTHTPPFGILDVTRHGKKAGCTELVKRMEGLGDCRLHIFGHIHEACGAESRARVGIEIETVFVNASLADADQAIIVDLRK